MYMQHIFSQNPPKSQKGTGIRCTCGIFQIFLQRTCKISVHVDSEALIFSVHVLGKYTRTCYYRTCGILRADFEGRQNPRGVQVGGTCGIFQILRAGAAGLLDFQGYIRTNQILRDTKYGSMDRSALLELEGTKYEVQIRL